MTAFFAILVTLATVLDLAWYQLSHSTAVGVVTMCCAVLAGTLSHIALTRHMLSPRRRSK